MCDFLGKAFFEKGGKGAYSAEGSDRIALDIPTLEGTMRAEQGDWIIRGVHGEFYPCKPDIFAATYEPAEDIANVAVRRDAVAASPRMRLLAVP
jgi:hypothetical protein